VSGFRAFVLRGNVIDLAVGVVIGAAFTGVVTSVVNEMINPLIGLFGSGNFNKFSYHVGTSGKHVFGYGKVLSALISFVLTAAVLYSSSYDRSTRCSSATAPSRRSSRRPRSARSA